MRLSSYFILLCAVTALAFGGCSSSTSTPPPATTTALSAPATLDFGTVTTMRARDTSFQVTNVSRDTITITGGTFSSGAGYTAKDTISPFPIKLLPNQQVFLHAWLLVSATGAQSLVETINYTDAGASQTTTITVKANGVHASPGVGSTFTFDTWSYDSSASLAGAHSDSVYTIVSRTASVGGKTNVISVLKGGDTLYYHQEANGDISRYLTVGQKGIFTSSPFWVTLPVASHTKMVFAQPDTTAVILAQNATISDTVTSTWLRSETVQTMSGPIQTQVCSLVVSASFFIPGFGDAEDVLVTFTIWYAPELEFVVESHQINDASGTQNALTTNDELIKSYNLK